MKRLIKFENSWIDIDEISGAEAFEDMGVKRLKVTLKGSDTFFLNGDEAEDLMELLDRWSLRLDAQSRPFEAPYDPTWTYAGIWEGAIDINNYLVEIITILLSPMAEKTGDSTDQNLIRIVDKIEAITSKLRDRL